MCLCYTSCCCLVHGSKRRNTAALRGYLSLTDTVSVFLSLSPRSWALFTAPAVVVQLMINVAEFHSVCAYPSKLCHNNLRVCHRPGFRRRGLSRPCQYRSLYSVLSAGSSLLSEKADATFSNASLGAYSPRPCGAPCASLRYI